MISPAELFETMRKKMKREWKLAFLTAFFIVQLTCFDKTFVDLVLTLRLVVHTQNYLYCITYLIYL